MPELDQLRPAVHFVQGDIHRVHLAGGARSGHHPFEKGYQCASSSSWQLKYGIDAIPAMPHQRETKAGGGRSICAQRGTRHRTADGGQDGAIRDAQAVARWRDGRMRVGIVRDETATAVTLIQPIGQIEVLLRADIWRFTRGDGASFPAGRRICIRA